MAAVADCTKSIKNMGSNDGSDEMQQLLKLTEKAAKRNESIDKSAKKAIHTNAEQ